MKRMTAVVAILSVAALGAQERKFKSNYAQDGVYWAASWEEALKEAKERNVGIHLAIHKDN
jgi:sugar phosphate isomerase/epimerase